MRLISKILSHDQKRYDFSMSISINSRSKLPGICGTKGNCRKQKNIRNRKKI